MSTKSYNIANIEQVVVATAASDQTTIVDFKSTMSKKCRKIVENLYTVSTCRNHEEISRHNSTRHVSVPRDVLTAHSLVTQFFSTFEITLDFTGLIKL